ncbi:uncharacterized protein LY79DRAFT_658322 [Colletotrichum navitas]|uniref:Uncharacterized protein n=1 Tax=Colletotrichum navitas TaxID=681940 RepID=A0AAD8V613_9PEZI|nr:uncharacterized protein LY79DRAFT_658322 [Colletotrichum navitas]KAK1594304.1 hypothetical protein LY79DRAFT_658322 [Colletotrichum navitas]
MWRWRCNSGLREFNFPLLKPVHDNNPHTIVQRERPLAIQGLNGFNRLDEGLGPAGRSNRQVTHFAYALLLPSCVIRRQSNGRIAYACPPELAAGLRGDNKVAQGISSSFVTSEPSRTPKFDRQNHTLFVVASDLDWLLLNEAEAAEAAVARVRFVFASTVSPSRRALYAGAPVVWHELLRRSAREHPNGNWVASDALVITFERGGMEFLAFASALLIMTGGFPS